MSNRTVESFTLKLLEAKIFNCDRCDKLLTLPVMLVENVGNMCAQCFSVENCKNGLPNKKLEMILKELIVPCKYKNYGCHEKILFENLESHQEQCNFQPQKCIYDETCAWNSSQDLLIDHYIQNHSDKILCKEQGVFNVEIPLKEFKPIKLLLRTRKDIFILRIDLFNNCLVYQIGDPIQKKPVEGVCTIKHLGQSGTNLEITCDIFQKFWCGKIDLKFIQQVRENNSPISILIEITMPDDLKGFDENILENLECPICKNLMKPPIYLCLTGHNVCRSCKLKLRNCPTCRQNFGGTRNYAMEAVTENILYPCLYQDLGCIKMCFSREAENHELVCRYKPIPCPVNNDCSFRGNRINIIPHLKGLHGDEIILSNEWKYTVKLTPYKTFGKIMIFDDNIFQLKLSIYNSGTLEWTLETCRQCDEKTTFIFDIELEKTSEPRKKLIMTETGKICLPNDILYSFIEYVDCEGMLTFNCRIHHKV